MKKLVLKSTVLFSLFFIPFSLQAASPQTWDLTIDEIIFNPDHTGAMDLAPLSGGNAVLAFYDLIGRQGRFVFYDDQGIPAGQEHVFMNNVVTQISVTALLNGNFLIAYGNDEGGKFIIYDNQGALVRAATIFKDARVNSINAMTFSNGRVLIAYRDDSDYDGKFVIYDADGNLECSETTYYTGTSGGIHTTALLNGNALIAYWDGPGDQGEFVICTSSGEIVTPSTAFCNEDIAGPYAVTLANDNILITYSTRTYPYQGHFVILDENGNILEGPVNLGLSASTDRIAPTVLSTGDVLVSYRRGDAGDNSGSFIILDEEGNLLRDRTPFYIGVVNNRYPVTLASGNVLIPFTEGGTPWYGKLACIHNPADNPWDLDGDHDVDGSDLILFSSGLNDVYSLPDIELFSLQMGYAR